MLSPEGKRIRKTTGARPDRSESITSGNTGFTNGDPFLRNSNNYSAARYEKATEWTTGNREEDRVLWPSN